MEKIIKSVKVGNSRNKAFQKFLHEINEWWPKEYTWSQDQLKKISIEAKENGLCSEIGPYGFRCDWGRVSKLTENEAIELKWQIGPKREPVPNPDKASDIKIGFRKIDGNSTELHFEHFNFENHGDGADEYQKMMNGKMVWDYILDCYKTHCEK